MVYLLQRLQEMNRPSIYMDEVFLILKRKYGYYFTTSSDSLFLFMFICLPPPPNTHTLSLSLVICIYLCGIVSFPLILTEEKVIMHKEMKHFEDLFGCIVLQEI